MCALVEVKKKASFNDNAVCQTIGYYIARKPYHPKKLYRKIMEPELTVDALKVKSMNCIVSNICVHLIQANMERMEERMEKEKERMEEEKERMEEELKKANKKLEEMAEQLKLQQVKRTK